MQLSQRLFNRGILYTLSAASALRGIRDNLRAVIWQPFALSLGLNMLEIGGLESLLDLMKLLFEPALGVVSDALGRKRLLILREVLVVAAIVLVLFARSWHLLFVSMTLIGLSSAFISIWGSVVAESAELNNLGFVYSVVGACYTGAGLVGTLAAGYLADRFGYGIVYAVATGFALLSLAVVWLKLPETMKEKPKRVNWYKAATAAFKALNPPKELRGFYMAMGLDLFAFGMGVRLLSGMLSKSYGYSSWMIGLYVVAMTFTQAFGQIFTGRLADKFGYSRFMAASQFSSCIMLGMMIYSKEFIFVFIAHLLFGLSNSFWIPAEQAWIATHVNPKERAQALGSFSTVRGLIGFPAPILGGILFDALGFDVPIALNLVIAFVDALLILFWVKDK